MIRGVALEWMMGERGRQNAEAYREASDATETATRYLVETSNRLKSGDEVVVFSRVPEGGNCGTSQVPVGHRGVIIARERQGVLTTNRCINTVLDSAPTILRKLGLADGWDSLHHSEPVEEGQEVCTHPENLGDAIEEADIVAKFRGSSHACWSQEGSLVLRYLYPTLSWKGQEDSGWLRVGSSARRVVGMRLEKEVSEATSHHEWPWDAFLRRSGDSPATARYRRSECFAPPPPARGELGVSSLLNEHLPLRADWYSEIGERTPIEAKPPRLPCARMTQEVFEEARSKLLAAKQGRAGEEPSRTLAPLKSRPGAHADGCALVPLGRQSPLTPLTWVGLAAAAAGWIRTRSRRGSTRAP